MLSDPLGAWREAVGTQSLLDLEHLSHGVTLYLRLGHPPEHPWMAKLATQSASCIHSLVLSIPITLGDPGEASRDLGCAHTSPTPPLRPRSPTQALPAGTVAPAPPSNFKEHGLYYQQTWVQIPTPPLNKS